MKRTGVDRRARLSDLPLAKCIAEYQAIHRSAQFGNLCEPWRPDGRYRIGRNNPAFRRMRDLRREIVRRNREHVASLAIE